MCNNTEEDLLDLMGKGNIKQVLKKIRNLVDNDGELKAKWAFASGRWSEINTRFQLGTVDQKAYDQDRNAFSLYLISLIQEVSAKYNKPNLYGRQNFENVDNDDFFQVYSNLKTPDEIWTGFVKDFKSYNDSWLMEYICPEDYVDTHKARYGNPDCGAFKFLFFPNSDSTNSDWKPFVRFAKFQALVHFDLEPYQIEDASLKDTLKKKLAEPLPETLQHIRVYLNFKEAPQQTFFRGYRREGENSRKLERVSIWYLVLDNNDQLPGLILKSGNEDFWKELDKKWNNSRKTAKLLTQEKIFQKLLELPDELFDHMTLVN